MHCTTTKEVWDKLCNVYHGDDKVRKENVQTHKTVFEGIWMKEDESIAAYFLRVDEVVHVLKGLGETTEDKTIVQKILCTLLFRFNTKVFAVEEMIDLEYYYCRPTTWYFNSLGNEDES